MQDRIKEALIANGLNVDDIDLHGPLAYVQQVIAMCSLLRPPCLDKLMFHVNHIGKASHAMALLQVFGSMGLGGTAESSISPSEHTHGTSVAGEVSTSFHFWLRRS